MAKPLRFPAAVVPYFAVAIRIATGRSVGQLAQQQSKEPAAAIAVRRQMALRVIVPSRLPTVCLRPFVRLVAHVVRVRRRRETMYKRCIRFERRATARGRSSAALGRRPS